MNAKQIFLNYADNYDKNNGMINLKIIHTLQVAKMMDRITELLHLDQELRELAYITAIFHDIGRFEQIVRYGTFLDHLSVDHAELGCEVLQKEHMLDVLPEKDQQTILIAIRNHNRYQIESGLDARTEMISKLIRDADKADIFRVFACENMVDTMGETMEQVETEVITDAVYDCIFAHRCVDKLIRKTGLDKWIGFLGFFFDINFDETIQVVAPMKYYRMPFDRADFKDSETKQKVREILNELESFISTRINNKKKGT